MFIRKSSLMTVVGRTIVMEECGGREGDYMRPEMLRVWTGPVAVGMAADSTEITQEPANIRLHSGTLSFVPSCLP